jgi:hypothetical protein
MPVIKEKVSFLLKHLKILVHDNKKLGEELSNVTVNIMIP